MSPIPTDIPTNVAPPETAGVSRTVDPAAAESGSFGKLLQRVQSPASPQDQLRRVARKPISTRIDHSVAQDRQVGLNAESNATPNVAVVPADPPILDAASVTDTAVQTAPGIGGEAIIINSSVPVETSEVVASTVPFKQIKKKIDDSHGAIPSLTHSEPDKGQNVDHAKVPQDAQPDSPPSSDRPYAKIAAPVVEPIVASPSVVLPAQLSPVVTTDVGSGKRPRSAGSQPEAAISAAAPSPQSTDQSQSSQIVPTNQRTQSTPLPSPTPLEPKLQPQSQPAAGRLNAIERVRFVQRVARAVQSAVQRGGEIRLRLSPPELGSLTLEVIVREGVMNARLETETTTARTILLDNLPALRDRLAEQNVKVDRFDVDVRDGSAGSLPDQTAKQADAEAQRGGAGGKTRRIDPAQADAKPPAVGPRVVGQGQFNVVV